MDLELIEKLMRMLEQSSLEELDVTEAGMRIRLAKQRRAAGDPLGPIDPDATAQGQTDVAIAGDGALHAGLSGTFYRARSPGEAPFVEVGSLVRDGQQLAIIEAMKMFNPVECDRDGVVLAIHIENGAPVDQSDLMFTIGQTDDA
ncbi:MAG: hypothetical protein RLZZ444_1013 [Pseudomonadota bacterium]|jgi:biotin carboxyl carrier protein